MEQQTTHNAQEILKKISEYLQGNERMCALFATYPKVSIEAYQNTARYYATKKYEDEIKDKVIPHGFSQILEQEINKQGILYTVKKYDHEIQTIADTMGIEKMVVVSLLQKLRHKPNESLAHTTDRTIAATELKTLIRRFTSAHKEKYIKSIIDQKMNELKDHIQETDIEKSKSYLDPETFINYVLYNKILKETIESLIQEKIGISPETYSLEKLLRATFSSKINPRENSVLNMAQVLNIKEPPSYQSFTINKDRNRLKRNFEPKLNKLFSKYTEEQKQNILYFIKWNYLAKKQKKSSKENTTPIKALINRNDQDLIEEMSTLMANSSTTIDLINGKFIFNIPHILSEQEAKECREYIKKMKAVKKIHNGIYSLYQKQDRITSSFVEKAPKTFITKEENYQIDITHWLSFEKIKTLIDKIDITTLEKLSQEQFELLRKFLVEEGILWAYIADNIDIDTMVKIINNFEALTFCIKKTDFTINNLEEIIRKAKLYDYANELIIGLIGIDNVAKIINYNQFLGRDLTDDVIYSRLEKAMDLAVRSEKTTKSSLPFNCDIKLDDYALIRYKNNDPNIFSCGIDTKTCFFISVNENDFFFYSLLNKNGYTIKIVNSRNELVARASCFRKNNVLMINGIRCKNNKVIPESEEDLNEFKRIVELITLMAKKMIELTSADICPIDYVVCNKAGILENNFFEGKFESINAQLFKEPINIYGPDWEEFVHLYDNQKQLLQEVPYSPEHSFTTDFGCNYPALLIASRDYRGLLSPRDISLDDQPATYERPRKEVMTYIGAEITEEVINAINRIRALNCFVGTKEEQEQKQKSYKLLRNTGDIKNIIIGEDWYILTRKNNEVEIIYATETNRKTYEESQDYIVKYLNLRNEDVKIYVPTKERTYPSTNKKC